MCLNFLHAHADVDVYFESMTTKGRVHFVVAVAAEKHLLVECSLLLFVLIFVLCDALGFFCRLLICLRFNL